MVIKIVNDTKYKINYNVEYGSKKLNLESSTCFEANEDNLIKISRESLLGKSFIIDFFILATEFFCIITNGDSLLNDYELLPFDIDYREKADEIHEEIKLSNCIKLNEHGFKRLKLLFLIQIVFILMIFLALLIPCLVVLGKLVGLVIASLLLIVVVLFIYKIYKQDKSFFVGLQEF